MLIKTKLHCRQDKLERSMMSEFDIIVKSILKLFSKVLQLRFLLNHDWWSWGVKSNLVVGHVISHISHFMIANLLVNWGRICVFYRDVELYRTRAQIHRLRINFIFWFGLHVGLREDTKLEALYYCCPGLLSSIWTCQSDLLTNDISCIISQLLWGWHLFSGLLRCRIC